MKNNIKTRKQKLLTLLNEAIDDNQDYAVDCLLELKEEDEDFERELQELDIVDWLEKNHLDEKKCFNYGANLIDTLVKFRAQVLGEK